MGEWREGQDDSVLETRNLGPCIGIAIYELRSKKGFLGHIPLPQDLYSAYNELEDHLRVVFADQPDSFSRMKAWLSGGSSLLASAITPGTVGFIKENQDFVASALTDIGIPKESVQVSWTPENHLSANMSLNCATGTCQIDFIRRPNP
jgi:chemotaxis receptor (MCP) glutamine deamidase CheD